VEKSFGAGRIDMTDWQSQPNYLNDIPLERTNVQKHSVGITHLKEVIAGTNVVKIVTDALADLCVTTAKLANLAVTTAKIAAEAVTTEKIADANVTAAKLAESYSLSTHTHPSDPIAIDDLSDVTVSAPTVKQQLTYSHGTQLTKPATAPTVADGGAGLLTGTYTYKVTFTDAHGETDPGPESSSTGALSGRQVGLTDIPTGGSGTTGRKIYRSDGVSYLLVATISDNTTTTYTDNNASPAGAIPSSNTTGELKWRNESLSFEPGDPGQQMKTDASGAVTWSNDDETWNIIFDGGGSDIAVGTNYVIQYDDNYSIQQWAILSKQSGSIRIDIWKSAALPGGYPPTDSDSITAGNEPALSSADYAADATLTGWTTTLEAGRALAFNVDSCSGVQTCAIALKVRRTD
jgi:hypothetical protein